MIPFIVGIAGPSCAGKTVVARRLQELIPGSLIISADNYWKDPATFPKIGERKNWELPENLDFGRLAQNLLSLQAGRQTHAPLWKQGMEVNPHEQTLMPAPVIIVEGFLLLHDEAVRDLLDLKVYMDVPEETIVERRIALERSDRTDKEFYYRNVVVTEYKKYGLPTRKFANIVIDGLSSADSSAHYLASEIKSREARSLHAQRDP